MQLPSNTVPNLEELFIVRDKLLLERLSLSRDTFPQQRW